MVKYRPQSKEHKLLSYVSDDLMGGYFQDVEMDCFSQRSALSNQDNITFLNRESGWDMGWDVSVSFLISVVFRNIVEIISTHYNCTLHLGWDDNSLKNLSSNGHSWSEGTFLVNVVGFNSLFRSLEIETNLLVVSDTWTGLLCEQFFAVKKNVILFLEGSLVLCKKERTWISAICGEY